MNQYIGMSYSPIKDYNNNQRMLIDKKKIKLNGRRTIKKDIKNNKINRIKNK